MAAAGAGAGPGGGEGKKRGASRSWILLDAAGEERVLDADKYAIMHRVDINARDLRILDPLLSYPSTILGRERAIVLNLEVRNPPWSCPVRLANSIVSFFVRWMDGVGGIVEQRLRAGFPVISEFRLPFADFLVVIVLFVARYGAANRVLEPNCCQDELIP